MDSRFDGLQEIIDKALASMEAESTGDFDPQNCNLAEFCRRTGIFAYCTIAMNMAITMAKPNPSIVSGIVTRTLASMILPNPSTSIFHMRSDIFNAFPPVRIRIRFYVSYSGV